MKIRFSVIVPVYNSEKTITRCLNSLLTSKRQDIEIIIVNDGSLDDTDKICIEYAERDDRIKYFKKSNGGVSSARNFGLKYAEGEYICFVDSDDFVDEDYFEKIDFGLEDEVDFLMYGKYIYDGDQYKACKNNACSITGQNGIAEYLSKALRKQLLNLACDKVYKRELINKYDIHFPEQIQIGEDKVFVLKYIIVINSMKSIGDMLYYSSTENQDSLSRKKRENLSNSILNEHEMMLDSLMKSELTERNKDKYLSAVGFSFYRSAYTAIRELSKFDLSKAEMHSAKKKIINDYYQKRKMFLADMQTMFIAWPVKLKMIKIIDLVLTFKDKE